MQHSATAQQLLLKELGGNPGDAAHVAVMSQCFSESQGPRLFALSGPSLPSLGDTGPGIPDMVIVHVEEISPAVQWLKPVLVIVGRNRCGVSIERTLGSTQIGCKAGATRTADTLWELIVHSRGTGDLRQGHSCILELSVSVDVT
jgi:hypothetical protein